NLRDTVEALPAYIDKRNIDLFGRHGILTRAELEARYEIHLENYCKVVTIESNTLLEMTRRYILPAATTCSDELATAIFHKQTCGISVPVTTESAALRRISELSSKIYSVCGSLETALKRAPAVDGGLTAAKYYRDQVEAKRRKMSELINELEILCAAKNWPFPTYADILFAM
ncbi:MAG: glutamine synthetase type III, partial [Oscillospiraceae bacterium]|nr:glutamine synthetase type III [Oscillospiraceae bacterium]